MQDQLITVVLVAVVLGMDAFSLSLGMGLQGVTRKYEMRFASTVGLFHVFMPLAGLTLGLAVGKILGIWAARIGAAILVYIAFDFLIKGYKEIRVQSFSFREGKELFKMNKAVRGDNWKTMLILGLSVSVDALTVGFSLGTLKVPVLMTVIIMGFTAGIMTFLGFVGGRIFSRIIGSYAQILGGLILLGLAVKMIL